MSMTGKIERVEVITSVQRRRRWSAEEKAAIVQETYAPSMSVSLVARRHGIAPNQSFARRRSTPTARCRWSEPARRWSLSRNTGPYSNSDLSPVSHPGMSRVGWPFERTWLDAATGWGA